MIADEEDSIYETKAICGKEEILGYGISRNGSIATRFERPFADGNTREKTFQMTIPNKITTIHESPELWEKVR